MSVKKFEGLDADESIFFQRELMAKKAKTYDILYPELRARSLFPISKEAGPGATSIQYEQHDMVGMAKIISSYADDLPRADIKGKEFISPVKSLGDSYGYNIQEIRSAKMAGKPLEQKRANSAKRAMLYQENQIALLGDTNTGLPGFLSNANVPLVVLAADGTGATTTFSTKTPDQIIRDLNKVVNSILSVSKGVEVADTVLLPIDQYTLISTTARSSNSDTTILEYFKKNNPMIKEVSWLNELDGAGAGGTDRMVVYTRNPDKLTMEVPQDFEQFPAQAKGLEFVIPCHMRVGGVIMYYPLSAAFADGI